MGRKKKFDWSEYWNGRVWIKTLSDENWKEENKTLLGRLRFFSPFDDNKILQLVDKLLLMQIKTGELYEAQTIWVKRDKVEFEVTHLRTQKADKWPKSKLWSRRSEFWVYNDIWISKAFCTGYIDLEKTFDTKVAIPNAGGVYFFYDKDKGLLYVGKTKNLNVRLREHLKSIQRTGTVNFNWFKGLPQKFKYLCYIIDDDPLHQSALEYFSIKHMNPLINVSKVGQAKIDLPISCQL